MISTVLKGISIIALLLLIGYSAIYLTFSQSYLTQANCNGEKIIIERNQYGIATLHVNSIESYLYGLGTIEAEDRLFQMSLRAYSVQGRLSQFLGQKTLQFDRFMREVNLKKWAEARALRLKTQNISEYTRLEYMAKGINDRVASYSLLPLQFYLTGMKWQNFTVNHIFYLFGQFEWSISKNLVDEYTRSYLLNNYTKQQIQWILPNKKETWAFKSIPIVSEQQIPQRLRTENMKINYEKIPFEPVPAKRFQQLDSIQYGNIGDATNCWAVKGQYTQSGFPILSNDPHLESVAPSQWYPFKVNLTLNGQNHYFVGGSNPGSPHAYGRSDYSAVGFSVLHGDNQDLYRETIKDGKYLIDGEWKDLKRRVQTISIKKGSQLIKEQYQILQTHRGPIINYIFGPLGSYNLENDNISLAWTGYHDQYKSYTNITYYFLAKNFDELQNILANHTTHFLSVNMMLVTKDNHIIMQQGGLHPIRRNYDSGNYIKNGQTSEHDWVGIMPSQDRIRLYDPPKGFFIHANNRLSDSGYYGGYFDSTIFTPRADRLDEIIRQQISSGRKINPQFMKKVLMDTVDVYCRQILPEITSVIKESQKYLGSFDCDFRANSTIATIYQVFMYKLHLKVRPFVPEKMGLASLQQMKQGVYNYVHFAYRGDIQKQQKMRQAWSQTFDFCQNFFKTKDNTKWFWSLLHTDVTSHMPFKNHPILSKIYNLQFPGSGNAQTLNVAKMNSLQFGDFSIAHRANTRVIYNMDSISSSWYIVDTGVSQNIFSKHYSDMWSLFKQGKMLQIKTPSMNNQEQL